MRSDVHTGVAASGSGRTVRRLVWAAVLALAITAVLSPATRAADDHGAQLYTRYCASCHGPEARGDGPDAAIFSERPRDLRTGFLGHYPADDLVARVRDGRSLSLALDPATMRAHATNVEALVTYLRQLPTINWRLVEEGEGTYASRCETCHGRCGTPGATLPAGVRQPCDLAKDSPQRSIDDKELMSLVRHGRVGMPALTPRVSEAEAKPLAAFVRLLSPGYALYSRYCANCHADDGRGTGTLGEAIRLPTAAFDAAYFAKYDTEHLRATAWHMLDEHKPAMPHYRTLLDDRQARAIVEYLKRLP